jgi:hypothetical protein
MGSRFRGNDVRELAVNVDIATIQARANHPNPPQKKEFLPLKISKTPPYDDLAFQTLRPKEHKKNVFYPQLFPCVTVTSFNSGLILAKYRGRPK